MPYNNNNINNNNGVYNMKLLPLSLIKVIHHTYTKPTETTTCANFSLMLEVLGGRGGGMDV